MWETGSNFILLIVPGFSMVLQSIDFIKAPPKAVCITYFI